VTLVIFGAGETAAATARQVAAAELASRIVLVDAAGTIAEGKALDISQASAVDRYDTRLAGSADEAAAVSASIIVIADRAGESGEWSDEAGLALLQRLSRLNARAPILCAGVRQRSLIDRGVHDLGLLRTRLFGTAPEALRGAVASLVALEAEASPRDLSLLVLGRPPRDVIVPWDTASIGGRRAIDVLSPPAITRLDHQAARLWPPGPMSLASAAARVIRSMITRAPTTHVLEVALTRDEHAGASAAMLPARVCPSGLLRVDRPPLSSRDRVRLESTLAH
jgi:malate/lactate dehydrogenase